jgi:hypothetical protein
VTIDVIFQSALRSAALTAMVWLGLTVLRITNPYTRMAALRALLAASLAMPLLMHIQSLVGYAPSLTVPHVFGYMEQIPIVTLSVQPSGAAAPAKLDLGALAALVYVLVAVVLTARLVLGVLRTWLLCRSARAVSGAWAGGSDVRATPRLRAPVTFGGTILLPDSYTGWSASKRDAVMAHERRHIGQSDFAILLLAALNRAIFWFNPAAWWLHAQLAATAEEISDAAALAVLGDRFSYAEILVDVASHSNMARAAVAMARASTIDRRVARIVAQTTLPAAATLRKSIAVSLVVMAPALLAARAVASSVADRSGDVAVAMEDNSEQAVAERRYAQARPRYQVPVGPALLDDYVGQYELAPGAIFTITRNGDRLFAQLTGQPAAEIFPDSNREFFYRIVPAQLTFLPGGHVPAIGLVLHQNGYEQYARRIDAAEVQRVADTMAEQSRRTAPSPGSEAALRKMIADEQRGQPNYASMGPGLAKAVRTQLPALQTALASLGALRELDFTGLDPRGADTFKAHFANGDADASIKLAPNGQVIGMRIWAAP